jgi:putative transposase
MIKYEIFIKQVIIDISTKYDFKIKEIEADKNHIHMLISARPDINPSTIVKLIKQKTSYELWRVYENEMQKQFWKRRVFWNRSSFISSVGDVNEKAITDYIRNQKH